ncbi:FxsA family protein [Chitinolyticbacter meiyuanensis]|uniref:FxsA family protein n=1 Tax=Chitinolyticbacter meiyuanensis TaxID=682798 RepID=UPI0016520FB8|nr:FxsA family protein [Chitinolyticbacter meiyuanensis]
MPYLVLLLLAYPAAEIVAFILAAKAVGVGWLLAWIVLSAIAGGLMLRHHKLAVAFSLVSDLRSGKLSVGSLIWVARYYLAAVLLLMPGLIGDAIGLILLLPWGRRAGPLQPPSEIIDGEYRRIDPSVAADHRIKR